MCKYQRSYRICVLGLWMVANGCAPHQQAPVIDAVVDANDAQCMVEGPDLSWPAELTSAMVTCEAGQVASRLYPGARNITLALNEPQREVCIPLYSCGKQATTLIALTPEVGASVEGWELTFSPPPGTILPPIPASVYLPSGIISPPHEVDLTATNRVCARTVNKLPAAVPNGITVKVVSDDCIEPTQFIRFAGGTKP